MKHLPKHLRPKWRYVAVGIETDPEATVDRGSFQRAFWYATQNLLGDATSADVDGTVVRFAFDGGDGELVCRVRRGEVEAARAALACIHQIDGDPVAVRVRGVSGTIRACEERYMDGPTEATSRTTVDFDDETAIPAVRRDDRYAIDTTQSGRVYATVDDATIDDATDETDETPRSDTAADASTSDPE